MKEVDIWSKGEVVRYLQNLLEKGEIKDCKNMKVKQGYTSAFYPECIHDWASRKPANNVYTISTGYGAPSSYHWPECPIDCPMYSKSDNFVTSVITTKKEISTTGIYVDLHRIQELKSIKNSSYDTSKLVRFCEELNLCYPRSCVFAVGALLRTIIDHIPPIFEKKNFAEVANNYNWGSSRRKLMIRLEECSRKISDSHLHQKIRKKESLPTMTQVDFKNELDVLLEEIVRNLKNKKD